MPKSKCINCYISKIDILTKAAFQIPEYTFFNRLTHYKENDANPCSISMINSCRIKEQKELTIPDFLNWRISSNAL